MTVDKISPEALNRQTIIKFMFMATHLALVWFGAQTINPGGARAAMMWVTGG